MIWMSDILWRKKSIQSQSWSSKFSLTILVYVSQIFQLTICINKLLSIVPHIHLSLSNLFVLPAPILKTKRFFRVLIVVNGPACSGLVPDYSLLSETKRYNPKIRWTLPGKKRPNSRSFISIFTSEWFCKSTLALGLECTGMVSGQHQMQRAYFSSSGCTAFDFHCTLEFNSGSR